MSTIFSSIDGTLEALKGEVWAVEEEALTFSIFGADTSGANRTLQFQIRSTPTHGNLFDDDGSLLMPGDLIKQISAHPYGTGAQITFVGSLDFFNEPNSIARPFAANHFDFVVTAPLLEGDGFVSSYQNRFTVNVINSNDPPRLYIPYDIKPVTIFSSLSWDSQACVMESSNGGGTTSDCNSKLFITDIQVFDVDGNLDFVRVDVASTHGVLSLNEDSLTQADFASCSNRSIISGLDEVTWNCRGSGIGDREVGYIVICYQFTFECALLIRYTHASLAMESDADDVLSEAPPSQSNIYEYDLRESRFRR